MSMIEALPRVDVGAWNELESAMGEECVYSHVVLAFPGELPDKVTGRLGANNVLQVSVEDVDDALIIEWFEPVTRFLRGAVREGGRAAVVCAQGVSRSATLILAYMMEDGGIGAEDALTSLRRRYPQACPNDGFLRQLALWKEMGFEVDIGNPTYRSLKARQTAKNVVEGLGMDTLSLRNVQEGVEGVQGATATTAVSTYRCRSCRQVLATSENVMVDVTPGGEGSFTWKKIKKNLAQADSSSSDISSSIFVEPLSWMAAQGINEQAQGKIYCPNGSCKARLGSYSWSGMQDASGRWMTPAFQLHLGRMDEVREGREASSSLPSAAAGGIRQPRLGKPKVDTVSEGGRDANADDDANMLRRISCVIFDCDGVLVDSERASCEALRRSILEVTAFDIPHDFPQDFTPVFGMDVRSCLEYYMDAHDQEDAFRRACADLDGTTHDAQDWLATLAAKVAAAKGPHYEHITKAGISPIEGAEHLMRQATATLPTAIASSGSHAKIRHNLESAGLWGIVSEETIVSAQDVARGKPAPDVYIRALETVGCASRAKAAVVIEDSVHGIDAAIQAGIGYVAAMTTSLDSTQMRLSLERLRLRDPEDGEDGECGNEAVVTIQGTRCVIVGKTLPCLQDLLEMFTGHGYGMART